MIKIIMNHFFLPSILYYIFLFISLGGFVTQNGEILHIFGWFFLSGYRQKEEAARGVMRERQILTNFTKLTGKHLFRSLFFKHRGFFTNFEKFLREPSLQNTSGQVLLDRAILIIKIYIFLPYKYTTCIPR